jgi:6-pyruvoyltetrahydropterin/6-carboxytetrahydropterin synthase
MPHVTVTKLFEFEACHHLPNYKGACERMHGHSYKLEVTVTSFRNGKLGELDNAGMIMDFKELKIIVKAKILDLVDHQNLNDIYQNPTAENMVADFYSCLSTYLPVDIKIECVKLWETSSSYASISNH